MDQPALRQGKYRLVKVIGRGGTATVYLAVDRDLGKEWAVKAVKGDPEKILREAKYLMRLDHPALPRIVDVMTEGEESYLVMDYLKGSSVGRLLRAGRQFSQEETIEIGIHLCRVLEYLHGQNPPVLYRDMKPDNLIVCDGGQIKLVDFGIACEGGKGEAERYGTKGYAAPEQYTGVCDERTDLYGMGAVLQALAESRGKRVSPGMRRVIRKCMSAEPERRYCSATEARRALERLSRKRARGQLRSLLPVFVLLSVLLLSMGGVVREAEQRLYLQYVSQVRGYTASARRKSLQKEAERLCREAICLRPEQEEAYLCLLEFERSVGATARGIQRVEAYRAMYREETKEHQKVPELVGEYYFCGSVLEREFAVSYEKALEAWEPLGERAPDYIKVQKKLAGLLKSRSGTTWREVAGVLLELENCIGQSGSAELQYELCLAAAGICLDGAKELEMWMPQEPVAEGIRLLEEAVGLLEEGENADVQARRTTAWLRLGDACCLAGMSGETALLEKADRYYGYLKREELPEGVRKRVLLNLTAIRLEAQEWEAALEYLSEASALPEIEKDQNYQILKKKCEAFAGH